MARQESTDVEACVADVIFDSRSGGVEAIYTYRVDPATRPGQLVVAPLAGRPLVGLVWRVDLRKESELPFPIARLRSIESTIEGAALPSPLMNLARQVSEDYLAPLPSVIGAALPPSFESLLRTTWEVVESELGQYLLELSPLQSTVLAEARASGGQLKPRAGKPFSAPILKAIRLLEAQGILRRRTQMAPLEDTPDGPRLWRLTQDESRVEEFLERHSAKRPAQVLTVHRLRESGAGGLALTDIQSIGGVTSQVVRALCDAGLLEPVPLDRNGHGAAPKLNPWQAEAAKALEAAVRDRTAQGFLLFGVTGSGKTEVYLRAAAEALRMGRQVLYLVPEIALATQTIGFLRARFGTRVAVMHSDLAAKTRLAYWSRIGQGHSPLVLGARSALFAPLSNLGLIVMDEEHEGSYKQESSPRYQARELVPVLAREHGCPYLLGSATPSAETFYAAQSGHLTKLELPERAAEAKLPQVFVEDLASGYRKGHPSLLTPHLQELLGQTLLRKEQAILFLNRRAYSPFLVCRDCGHFFTCPMCAVSLSYSRKLLRLRCHHCGHQEPPPDQCPKCLGTRLNPFGVGTEKVEEAVRELHPLARVARLDRDVSQRKGALESILAAFGAHELDILVGTQIVAKGLNFPDVTLVGVVAADVSINLPDFRASERTFQLLSQVAGRAGRGRTMGNVVIQTFNPEHIAVVSAQRHDYLNFYQSTIEFRRAAEYPPFCRLVNVVFAGSGLADVIRLSGQAAQRLKVAMPSATIRGPAECPIERIQNRWRKHILIKMDPRSPTAPIAEALAGMEHPHVQVVIDVDPNSFM